MDTPKDQRVIIPMSAELIAAIDDYRYANRLPSRAEAIRSLIELGLQTIAQADQAPASYEVGPASGGKSLRKPSV
jgi:metal-responsive CopG/Arc/MetJ family transcriptional regulator